MLAIRLLVSLPFLKPAWTSGSSQFTYCWSLALQSTNFFYKSCCFAVVVTVQSISQIWLFATPWTAAQQASLSFTISQSLLKFMFIELVVLSNHLILCHPLLLLPSIFPRIWVFSKKSPLHIRWPKYWSFSFSPSNEYSGLISFGIDWFDFLAVQEILKSLLQDHNSKASNLWFSSFFTVQFSHLNMITGKTIALTIRSFFVFCFFFDYTDLCQQRDVSDF